MLPSDILQRQERNNLSLVSVVASGAESSSGEAKSDNFYARASKSANTYGCKYSCDDERRKILRRRICAEENFRPSVARTRARIYAARRYVRTYVHGELRNSILRAIFSAKRPQVRHFCLRGNSAGTWISSGAGIVSAIQRNKLRGSFQFLRVIFERVRLSPAPPPSPVRA